MEASAHGKAPTDSTMDSAALERQEVEIGAIRHIFGEDAVQASRSQLVGQGDSAGDALTAAVGVSVDIRPDDSGWGNARLRVDFRLPAGYPEETPPVVSVSCPELHRDQITELQAAARELIADLYRSPPGQECMFDIVSHLQGCAASLVPATGHGEPPTAQPNRPSAAAARSCLIRIDHMNSPQKYIRLLKKWADGLSLSGDLLLAMRQDGRAQNIALLLRGDEPGIQAFLARLRTEYVDVNSRRDKCKERHSEVLCCLPASAMAGRGGDGTAYGLAVTEYRHHAELEALLAARAGPAADYWPK